MLDGVTKIVWMTNAKIDKSGMHFLKFSVILENREKLKTNLC